MAATATANVFEAAQGTSDFLTDLLGSIGVGNAPEKTITDVNLKILTKVVSFVPLRERMSLSGVSHQFQGAVKASITSLNFYRDCLDCLPDTQVKEMLQQYGPQITSLNFDLFKSTFADETSQWVWRQTVLAFAALCPNLTELSILICNRHRLRDKDLVTIFEKCPHLTKLCVDAQFLNGHCFKKAPLSLSHVEMEMCYRISDQSLRTIFGRFRKMRVLHVSQLLVLTDAHIGLMVRSFRNLRELSIVSHVDTKYENLSGSGLAELGKLQKLRVLCLEGLGAVTDRTLTVISDSQSSPTAATITALSLAFCYNVSQHGLKHLGRMTSLVDLNIDGITKRDVSMGVEKIAAEGRLVRLFVAERTNLSPETLISVVQHCPQLRLLDISNNEECFNWVTADKMMYLWCGGATAGSGPSHRAPLTILTDEHLAWNCVGVPEPDDQGRCPLLVVHINRAAVPENELLPTNALSTVRPSELPAGLLAPHIRRGNRYRLLWAPLGPSKEIKVELFDEQENGVSVADLAMRAAQETEENPLERSTSSLDDAGDDLSSSYSMEGVECVGGSGIFLGSSEASGVTTGGGLPWTTGGIMGNDENMPPCSVPATSSRPADFSFTPISADGDPHSKDWSMDVISLLLKTYAYEDGAMVGPMTVKEGIIMRPDGSVEDICSSILKVDASLRARYHMTAALSGARRFGPHSYNAREPVRVQPPPIETSPADIVSAIDDFLGGYVPDDSQSTNFEPPMKSFRPRQREQQHHYPSLQHDSFPFEREMSGQQQQAKPMRGLDPLAAPFSPFSPLFSDIGGDEEWRVQPFVDLDGGCISPPGHLYGGGGCENEAPPTLYVPGGRVEGAGPKVAPVRYGSLQQEYGSLFRHDHHQQQRHQEQQHGSFRRDEEQMMPWSAQEHGRSRIPGSGRRTPFSPASAPFVPMHLRGSGLSSAPPAAEQHHPVSSSSFPPPAYLLPSDAVGGATATRPFGRARVDSGAAGAPPSCWLSESAAKLAATHPYQDAAYRARASSNRPSVLRPRNN